MFKAFGWDLVWHDGDGVRRLEVFGPYATLERAAWAANELSRNRIYAHGTFTVVEVEV